MSVEKCDNYEVCKKYATYGKCSHKSNGAFSVPMYCDVYEKQTINILASIDEKLSKLLEK